MISADILQFGTDEYLFVADSYSIWLELCFLGGKTANYVIAALKPIFARFGSPDVLLSDSTPSKSFKF